MLRISRNAANSTFAASAADRPDANGARANSCSTGAERFSVDDDRETSACPRSDRAGCS
jgi:hypothetical protein